MAERSCSTARRVRSLAVPSWLRSRWSVISERTSSMCMPADSAYWVTLSCSSRAIRCRSLSSTSRCRAAPSSAWVSSSSSLRAFSASACRVVRACSRSEWSSSAQFCRAAAVCPARIRSTEWSVSSICRSGGVQAITAPTTRPSSRIGTCRWRRSESGSCTSLSVPRRTWSRCRHTAVGTSSTAVASTPSGPRTRCRGWASASSPSTSAKTTHSADRWSAAASTTARTSASEPSVVRTRAAEMRSRAWITRCSRSAEMRYSG